MYCPSGRSRCDLAHGKEQIGSMALSSLIQELSLTNFPSFLVPSVIPTAYPSSAYSFEPSVLYTSAFVVSFVRIANHRATPAQVFWEGGGACGTSESYMPRSLSHHNWESTGARLIKHHSPPPPFQQWHTRHQPIHCLQQSPSPPMHHMWYISRRAIQEIHVPKCKTLSISGRRISPMLVR